jgi:hypothetical protein
MRDCSGTAVVNSLLKSVILRPFGSQELNGRCLRVGSQAEGQLTASRIYGMTAAGYQR